LQPERVPWDDEDLAGGPVPLWFQISERLRTALEKGEFVRGEALPSETALTKRFGVSRTTARAALDHLESAGLIERRSGRGSIVLPPKVEQPLNLLTSFGEDMRARGLRPGYRDVRTAVVRAGAEVAAALGVEPDAQVVKVDRLHLADDDPIALSSSYLSPAAVLPDETIDDAALSASLYAWLDHRGVRIAGGTEMIESDVADEETADRLQVPVGAALLVARRTARDGSGNPVEYAVRRYRADRYRYRIELCRP
jgi:GntR family transcriptional regulator